MTAIETIAPHASADRAPAATSPRDPHDRAGRRLQSLDLLRGLTVAGMITVNATAGVNWIDKPVFPLLLHANWAGFTLADAVFPAFITMVGVSIAVSTRPGATSRGASRRILSRAARLILLGLLLGHMFLLANFVKYWPPRLPGVLQRIGIVYAIVAFAYPRMSMRARGVAIVVLLLGYWGICLLPIPDGSPMDLWVQGHNLVSWVDRQLFGTWRYVKGPDGFDPEGLLSTLPTIAQALIGTLAGDLLRRGLPVREASRRLALAGVGGIATGLAWGFLFPIAKNLWTSSFVLLTAGITLTALSLFHLAYDAGNRPVRTGGLLGSFGRNAIAAYTLHEVASIILVGDAIQLPFKKLAPVVGTQWAALVPVAIFVALIWWPIAAMDRRGWYLRV